jgi:phosphopantothenoylcysteine decarboxylase/phosphopantothenate--cysteine ligase
MRIHFAGTVHVIMTRSARQFVTPYALSLVSGNPVFTDSFASAGEVRVPHIDLARRASLLLVMPATANILGKAAAGICDDLLSTTIVACQAPIVFVPNMNGAMWANRIVQQNVATLKGAGYFVIEPSQGLEVADWVYSSGAMPAFNSLVASLEVILGSSRSG